MDRLYDQLIKQDLDLAEEMLLLRGPRQVGKTTTSHNIVQFRSYFYLN